MRLYPSDSSKNYEKTAEISKRGRQFQEDAFGKYLINTLDK